MIAGNMAAGYQQHKLKLVLTFQAALYQADGFTKVDKYMKTLHFKSGLLKRGATMFNLWKSLPSSDIAPPQGHLRDACDPVPGQGRPRMERASSH